MPDHFADNGLDVGLLLWCNVWDCDVYQAAQSYVETVGHAFYVFVQYGCLCVVAVDACDVCLV